MPSSSIQHMYHAMDEMERVREEQEKEYPASSEAVHYWHVEKRTKRLRWKFHTELFMTKSEVRELWQKHYQGNKQFRLRHLIAY